MLKYSKNQNISINLSLINSDGTSEDNAIVSYELLDTDNNIITSNTTTYNSSLSSYIDIITPWDNQEEGIYYIKWNISNTSESFANTVVEELYIESYDEKLNKLLGLLHENMIIDQTEYDRYNNLVSARIRLYENSSSVGSDNDILATYRLSCNSSGQGTFTTWKQVIE